MRSTGPILCSASLEGDTQGIGVLAGIFRGQLDVQTVGLLPELQLGMRSEQGDTYNPLASHGSSKRPHKRLAARGANAQVVARLATSQIKPAEILGA